MNFSQLRKPTVALFLVILGAGTALAQTKAAKTATAPDDRVAFTATGTAVVTSVTKLPGRLTR